MPIESQIRTALGLAGVAFILGVWAYSEINKLKKELSSLKNKQQNNRD